MKNEKFELCKTLPKKYQDRVIVNFVSLKYLMYYTLDISFFILKQ